MTQVFVLIELTGNASECDGAIVQGAYSTEEAAEATRDSLVTTRKPAHWFEITEHTLDA